VQPTVAAKQSRDSTGYVTVILHKICAEFTCLFIITVVWEAPLKQTFKCLP